MAAPIFNPPIPFVGPVPGGMPPGKMIFLQGYVAPTANSFAVNLQCGPNTNPRDDIALHINARFGGFNIIVRNSLQGQIWGVEEVTGPFLLQTGQQFEMIILSEIDNFKIALNGQHFAAFPYRMPVERVSYLSIDGDVNIGCIRFETNMPQQTTLPGFIPGQVPAAAIPPMVPGPQPSGYSYGMPPNPSLGCGQYSLPPGIPYGSHSPSHSPMHSSSTSIPVPGGGYGHGHGLHFHTAPIVYPMGVMMGKHHMSKEMKKMHKHERKLLKHKHKHQKFKLKNKHKGFHHGHHKKSSSSSSSD